MNTIKNLNTMLVCLDLTDIDQALIRYASFLSQALETNKIIFIHAIQAYDLPDKTSKKFPDLRSSLSTTIEEEINSVVSNHFKKQIKTEVVTKIEDEDASEVIIDFIEKEKVDLTLVGQKYGEDREGHYGQRIAEQAQSDLMFVPEDPVDSLERILCAVDFSEASEKAFLRALEISRKAESRLTCHYIYDTSKSYFPASTLKTTSYIEKQFNKRFKKFLKKFDLKPEDVNCKFDVDDSLTSQAEKTYRTAKEEESQLVIIGAKGKTTSVTTLLGNITENLRRMDKEIPVMIMKNLKKKRKWV